MASCKYYDCGYCYAPKDIKSNDVKGACIEPEYCPYLKTQMTEKERIEGEIKILQKKLALIEELEKTKSPVEEAFKRVFSYDPKGCDKSFWIAFQNGYYAAQEDYKGGEYQEPSKETAKDKVPLYKRFENEGAYGQIYYDNALKVVRGFLIDEGVVECEDEEYITITLQKSLLDVPND